MTEYLGAAVWLLVAAFTYFLPQLEVPHVRRTYFVARTPRPRRLDAVEGPRHARHLHHHHAASTSRSRHFIRMRRRTCTTSASAHQRVDEPGASLGNHRACSAWAWLLLNWRLKWIFTCGLAIGVVRFAFSAMNTKTGLLLGIGLHGASFALVFITAQDLSQPTRGGGVARRARRRC